MLTRSCAPLFVLVAALPLACTSDGDPAAVDEPVAEGSAMPQQKLLFDCKPGASAPHPLLQVFRIEEDDPEASDPQEPEETEVVIETNHVEQGMSGTCMRRPHEDDPNSVRFACVSADARLRMYWPADAQAGKMPEGGQVEIKESWLFWTKNYTATCTLKAL